jgi:exopolysaccharide biosynthesis polyprenyl glycosylphosphotransferase
MIDIGGRQVRESLDPGRLSQAAPGSVPAAPRPDAPVPHLLEPEPRDRRGAIRTLLVTVDAAALALPALWLDGSLVLVAALVAVTVAVLAASGAHRPRISLSALDEAPRHLPRLGLGLLLVAPLGYAAGADLGLAVHALCAVPAFVVGRSLAYALVRGARRRGVVGSATLVLGGGRLGMDLLTTLEDHPEYGLRGVGFLSEGSPLDEREPLGHMDDLDLVLDTYGVRKVVVAYGPTREAEMVGLVRSAAQRDIEVYIVPRFFDVGLSPQGPDVEDLWGIPLHRVRRAALRRGVWRVKRLLDVVASGTALTLLAPLMALLALAVKISSPGPVLFRQPRTGHDGEDISILKFRTLRPAASAPEPHAVTGSTRSTMHARQIDVEQRQTRIGNVLRRTSLDELPQLWNILRGDMSLVGPRPEERTYAAQFADSVYGYRDRHRLAVGLTGWAQINGLRGDTSIEERARFDNSYIEHWSLWRDVVILVRTVAAVNRQAFTAVRSAAR